LDQNGHALTTIFHALKETRNRLIETQAEQLKEKQVIIENL